MIKIEYFEKEKKLLIYNEEKIHENLTTFDFIGDAHIKETPDENILEVNAPVARPKFGNLLYQTLGMFAYKNNQFICSSRDGDTRSAALNIWENLWKNIGEKVSSVSLDENLCSDIYEFTDEDESPFLFQAFNVKTNEAFDTNFEIKESMKQSNVPSVYLNEWEDFFSISYENDSNKFINEEHELLRPVDQDKLLSFKPKQKDKKRFSPKL